MIDLHFDKRIGKEYKSESQKIRVMSENWVSKNMFCPCCGYLHLNNLKNNESVADMKCSNCGEIFELKSHKGKVRGKINDGAYSTMIKRIKSVTNPELFVLQYSSDYVVTDLTLVPKFFFVPQFIEERKPLIDTARRAGWIGCYILYSEIPQMGKIEIIRNGKFNSINEVVGRYSRLKKLEVSDICKRSWLLEVFDCVNSIESDEFCLKEIYEYAEVLQRKHVNNHHVEAKIRQQLQYLRDRGLIDFLGKGQYRKRF